MLSLMAREQARDSQRKVVARKSMLQMTLLMNHPWEIVMVRVNQEEKCKRVGKPTQKGLEYQISLLEEKRRKVKSKMERKSKEIEDLLYST